MVDLRVYGNRLFRSASGRDDPGSDRISRCALHGCSVLPGRAPPLCTPVGPQHVPRGARDTDRLPIRKPAPLSGVRSPQGHDLRPGRCVDLNGLPRTDRRRNEPLVGANAHARDRFRPVVRCSSRLKQPRSATIAPASMGRASTLFNTGRQLGGAIGVALLTTVIATVGPTRIVASHVVADLGAYHASFVAAGIVEALGDPGCSHHQGRRRRRHDGSPRPPGEPRAACSGQRCEVA